MATCRLAVSVDYVFNHPVGAVYNVLSDFGSYPEWWPSPKNLHVVGPVPMRVGSTLELSNTPFVRWTAVVVELHSPTSIAMQYGRMLRGSAVWHLEPQGDSRTRVSYDIDVEPIPLWLRLIAASYDLIPEHRRQLRRIFLAIDRRLAQLANEDVCTGAAVGRS